MLQSFHFVFSDLTLKLVATVSPIILGIYLDSSDIAYFYTAFMLANLPVLQYQCLTILFLIKYLIYTLKINFLIYLELTSSSQRF